MKTFKQLNKTNQLNESHHCTDTQLLRKGITEELEVIVKYEQMSRKASDPRVQLLFLDIAKEEKVHVEEFEELLEELDPEMEEAEEEAEEELEELGIIEPEDDEPEPESEYGINRFLGR